VSLSQDIPLSYAEETVSRWSKHDTSWMLSLFGTAVGAGILFLPINIGAGGFWSLVIMALLAGPMTFLAHRGLARFVLSSSKPNANFTDVVEKSYKAKVWIVSPTTLMATLNTVRAVLKDARMREEAGRIQKEVMTLLEDVGRLDKRIENLDKHFTQTTKDIRDIQITTGKITKRGERIEEIQLGEDSPAEELAAPVDRIE